MKKQIVHISIHQTSKVIAAMHAAMFTVLFILPSALGYLFHGHIIAAILTLLIIPLLMWVLLYIGYVIACWFYNLVVPWTGGIEVNVANSIVEPETTSSSIMSVTSEPPSNPERPPLTPEEQAANPDRIERL